MSGAEASPPAWLADLERSWPPAERVDAAGLALRADAPAAGSRVNSARRLGVGEAGGAAPPVDPIAAAARIEAFYAGRAEAKTHRSWAPLYQAAYPLAVAEAAAALPQTATDAARAATFAPQDLLEAALAGRGFAPFDPCLLLTAPSARVAAEAGARRSEDPRLRAVLITAPLAALDRFWEGGEVGPERRAVMRRALASGTAGGVVAFRRGHGVGGAMFLGLGGETGFVHALYADPEARRKGGAAQALGMAAELAGGGGAVQLAALVRLGNAPARGFFSAMGFELAGAYAYWRKAG